MNISSDVVIRTRDLGKCYQIYDRPLDRLKQSLWRGKREFFREFWALHGLSLDISRNETVGIIGSNGSGKSTLLQIIAGILALSTGFVEVKGRVSGLLELGSGFNPEFTGRENALMSCAITGLNRAQSQKAYEEIVKFAGIQDFMEQPVKTYSSGMYVRLAFACAVNVSPDILLIDEALAVGDIRFQQKCIEKMKSFCRKGTVLFVSHDTAAIIELCSRVIWLEGGRARMDGAPKPVIEKYLEYMYESEQGSGMVPEAAKEKETAPEDSPDQDLLETYPPVPDEIHRFGNRKATILRVGLRSSNGLTGAVYSGESCKIVMVVRVFKRISNPIVGFVVKDRMGREIIGDNTALIGKKLIPLAKGRLYKVSFSVKEWPNLSGGGYTLSVAIANGQLEHHEQCDWLHDAVAFESIPRRTPAGIFSLLDTNVKCVQLEA
jgi:lipopolysaccharide transport system ATP-binding protein